MARLLPVLTLVPAVLFLPIAHAAEEYANSSAYSATSMTSSYAYLASNDYGYELRHVGPSEFEVAAAPYLPGSTHSASEPASFGQNLASRDESTITDGCDWSCNADDATAAINAPALTLANRHGLLDNDMIGSSPASELKADPRPDLEFANWSLRK